MVTKQLMVALNFHSIIFPPKPITLSCSLLEEKVLYRTLKGSISATPKGSIHSKKGPLGSI